MDAPTPPAIKPSFPLALHRCSDPRLPGSTGTLVVEVKRTDDCSAGRCGDGQQPLVIEREGQSDCVRIVGLAHFPLTECH